MRFPATVVLFTTLQWAATEKVGGDGTGNTLARSKGRGQQGGAGSQRANPKANADVDGDKLVCKKYKNGNAKLALCELEMDDYMSENDRVAKVGLYLKNIGDVGVCNIALWVDGMNTDAMVDFWPNWIDITPNEGYLASKDGFELGANIFMPMGYPQYYLDAGFRECPSPDAVAEPTAHQYCHTIGGGGQGDGVLLEFCEDKLFDSWMKDDGSRIIHSQGRVTNNGTVNVCHLRFGGDRLAQAIRVWPKWFPVMTTKNSPAPLRVGDVMEVGADVPSNGFKRPSLSLLSYQACTLEVPQGDNANANAPSPTSPAHDTARLHDDQDPQQQQQEAGDGSTSAKPTDAALRGSASTTQRQQEIDGASFP